MIDPHLHPVLAKIQAIARARKSQAYLVGGFLRDLVLKRKTSDIDIALDSRAKQVSQDAARSFRCPVVALAEEEEVYRVFVKEDVHLDLARWKGETIEEDLSRRDFTLNALALRLDQALELLDSKRGASPIDLLLLDPHGGRKDIARGEVRQVSPAAFDDDPLRLLRAFRIAAQLGFKIEPGTLEAIRERKKKIRSSAAERIREELLLLLDCPGSYPFIRLLDEAGLISEIVPEVDDNRACALNYYPGKGVWGHSLDGLEALEWIFANLENEFKENAPAIEKILVRPDKDTEGHPKSTLMKLGILFHDLGKAPTAQTVEGRLRFFQHEYVGARMAKEIAKRLKFSSNASHSLSGLVLSHMRPGGLAHAPVLTERAKYRFFRDLGVNAIPMLLVALADRYTYIPQERGRNTDVHEKGTKDLIRWHFNKLKEKPAKKAKLIDGTILMRQLKLKPGPLVGRILKELDEAIATGEIKTRGEAVAAARRFLQTQAKAP